MDYLWTWFWAISLCRELFFEIALIVVQQLFSFIEWFKKFHFCMNFSPEELGLFIEMQYRHGQVGKGPKPPSTPLHTCTAYKCAFSHTLTHAGKRVLCKRLKGQSFCFFSRSVCVCPWVCPSLPPPLRPQINLLKVQISPLKPYISFLMHQISLLSPQNSPLKPQESGPCILQDLSLSGPFQKSNLCVRD